MSDYIHVSMDSTVWVNELIRQLIRQRDEARAEVETLRAEMPVAKSLETAVTCLRIERDNARSVVAGQVKEMADLRAEVERLRATLPTTAHSGVRNGPGEGSWSVFAEKVVKERDEARAEVERLREVLRSYAYPASNSSNNQANLAHYDGGARARKALKGER